MATHVKGAKMRKIIYLMLGISVLWGGYWLVGARTVESEFRTWLDNNQVQGLQTDYASLATRGFPNRFDTTITDVDFYDDNNGLGWKAPFVQIFALSYKPNHIIAAWPNEQTIRTTGGTYSIGSDKMRASVVLNPNTSLTFNRSVLEIENLILGSTAGKAAELKNGLISARQTVGRPNSYDFSMALSAIKPPPEFVALFAGETEMPATVDDISIRATVDFDRPWDVNSANGVAPKLIRVQFDNISTRWGDLHVAGQGHLQITSSGMPEGRIDISAKNWRSILQAFINTGWVDPNDSKTAISFLEIVAAMSGEPDTLKAPLEFQKGRMSFGPIPLGPAPKLFSR